MLHSLFPALITTLTLAVAFLSYKNAKMALTLLFGLLPLYLVQFSIGFFPTNLFELIATAFIVTQLPKISWQRDRYILALPLTRPLILLLAAACFGVVIANDSISALGIWKSYFILPAALYYFSLKTFTHEQDWKHAFAALATSAIALSVFAIAQATTGIGVVPPWDTDGRMTSFFLYPNALGLFLAPITAAAIVLATQKSYRTLWIITALLGTTGILLAQTEAALAAIPAGLLAAFLISKGQTNMKIRVTAEIIILGILAFAISPFLRSKILLQDTSGQTRLAQWGETLALLKTRPLTGAGLNEYPNALKPFHDPTFYEIFQYPHNIILNTWTELGALGLIALAWIALRTMTATKTQNSNPLILAAFAALVTMAIHGLVDVPYFKNDLAVMTWFFFALLSAQHLFSSKKEPKTPPQKPTTKTITT